MAHKRTKKRTTKPAQPKGGKRGEMQPFTVEQVADLSTFLRVSAKTHAKRDYALLRTAIDTMLRSVDLLHLTVSDVMFDGEIRQQFSIVQQKTGVRVLVSLSETTRAVLKDYLATEYRPEPDNRIFPLTTRWYQKIVKRWAELLHLDGKLYSTHSLRRTKASHVYKKTGNLMAVKNLLGHTDIRHTQRYLGVSKQDAIDLALSINI